MALTLTPNPYEVLADLGIALPKVPEAVANYAIAVREGALLYVSGQGPSDASGWKTGKVGSEVSIEQGYEHARLVAINLLAAVEKELGSLEKVRRIVKVFGMVNAIPEFMVHFQVINGCSDLLVKVFGDEVGKHARSAVGVASLPGNISVEIEMIVAIAE
jgi:enamine deaminase RidA (YjgF/YER057c/UK114 family)